MAKNNNLTDFVTDLADGFREKCGWVAGAKINPQEFRDYVAHAPYVGDLSEGLDLLNWTKTLMNFKDEYIECPNGISVASYFDEATGAQRLPLIQFTIKVLDPLTGDGEIRLYDSMTDASFGRLTPTVTEAKYILPVFGNLSTTQKYATFPPFGIVATDVPAAGVRVKMTAAWVQIGVPTRPTRLSCATMRGY